MISKLIYEYFKLSTSSNLEIFETTARNLISNEDLLKDTLAKFTFTNEWHNKLSKKLKHYHFNFFISDIEKLNNLYRVKVNRSSVFSYNITPKFIHKSKNEDFIFIISKTDKKYEIRNVVYKEENPNIYKHISTINLEDLLSSRSIGEFIWSSRMRDIDIIYSDYQNLKTSIGTDLRSTEDNLYISDYTSTSTLIDTAKLIDYARKYALNYNQHYTNFNNSGGDCTNFISQALNFAGLSRNYKWEPYVASWIMVIPLRDYLVSNNLTNEYDKLCPTPVGTIIQFFSPVKERFSHSGIITDIMDDGELLYCCHDYDKLDFPLSETYPIFYKQIRNLQIK